MAYLIAAIPTTLTDLYSLLSIASIVKWNFCTVVRQLTRFQVTQQSPCVSWASCFVERLHCEGV